MAEACPVARVAAEMACWASAASAEEGCFQEILLVVAVLAEEEGDPLEVQGRLVAEAVA